VKFFKQNIFKVFLLFYYMREQEEYEIEQRLSKIFNYIVGILFVGLIGLIFLQKGVVTGFVVGGVSESFVNAGILVCVIGIVGLLLYKFKK